MSASDEIARLRELRAKVTAGPWAIAGQRAEWATIITGKDGEAKIDARHPEDAAAIVAAMNSHERLLACAEALSPFATFGEIISSDPAMSAQADDTPAAMLLFSDGVRLPLTFADLRKARAALQALAEGGGE